MPWKRLRTNTRVRPGIIPSVGRSLLQKRLHMDGRLRLGIILALALLVLLPAFLALRAFQSPTERTTQVPVWGWVQWGEWDYTVFLKPNSIYETRELGADLTYYGALVDGIKARLTYTFATDTTADTQGWYEVTAEVAAGDLLRESSLVTPRTPLADGQRSDLTVQLELSIDRGAHRGRLEQMALERGVQAGPEPTVTYTAHIEASASTDTGTTIQVLEPTLIVPLTGETFTISGDRSQSEHGVIRRTEVEVLPGVEGRRRYTLVAAGIAALLPLFFALGTVARPPRENPLTREAQRLRRRYRKRIAVAGTGNASRLPAQESVALASMEDLARVSEELLKPIIYHAVNPGNCHIFYIVDGRTRYEYALSAPADENAQG